MAETQSGPEDIVVIPDSESIPLTKASPPGTPSGLVEGHSKFFDQRDRAMQATEQSGGSTTSRSEKSAGVAFSGGGIRSAAFCSGALRRMLLKNVLPDYLSCVSGGGYTGAAFVEWKEWKRRNRDNGDDNKWHDEFFDTMRQNAGYLCDWQCPFVGLWHSVVFVVLLVTVVVILPCVLWLPYAFPIAVAVDVLFGKILRQNATCPPSAHARTDPRTSRTSSLMLMLYENCHSPSRRTALIFTTLICSLLFYFLSRKKRLHEFKDILRLLSMISFIVFLFTLFPLLIHDLWPSNTWVRAFIIIICIVLPFFIPVIRNYASVFLVFYWYIHIVSWRVFKTELFGAVPYSDHVFYPILIGCAIAVILFPLIGQLHQAAFNVYYRFRLSKAFFSPERKSGKCRWEDVFPMCVTPIHDINSFFWRKYHDNNENENDETEVSLQTLSGISPTFISNITVNDWQINIHEESSYQLIAFSSEGVELIGKDQRERPAKFDGCFNPEHMRLSSAMAISGAALSFDMGEYESGLLNPLLELFNLLGLGMGDEMICNQCQVTKQKASKRYGMPFILEIVLFLPMIVLLFVYWLGQSMTWVNHLILVHLVIVVALSMIAVSKTGSDSPGKWEKFIRYCIRNIFFVRFVRGYLNVNNVGERPPEYLRLSDGGHFENLALLPLLEKRLEKIAIFDGSRNPGGDKYAESLLKALKLAREKLRCSFVGEDGRDINEDIKDKFLKIKSKKRPRSYRFQVHYYDEEGNNTSKGEILFIAPRHPSESIPLKTIDEQPKAMNCDDSSERVSLTDNVSKRIPWDIELDHKDWGLSPELTEREADRLTCCCCVCCHYYGSSHCVSDALLGRFPHHKTANQFFTPEMFSAYHREGYAACIEAKIESFFKDETTQDA